ncbi:MAG: HD domain-containing protein [Lachnospiraceae bacterium]|nr:HD domain-containing protein [Lachnospiraceae bacterium]
MERLKKYLNERRKKRRREYFERQKNIENELRRYASDILHSENFETSKNNMQHGTISVKEHSIQVARQSIRISDMLGIEHNRRDLIRGALLHDYFLYDWHHVDQENPHRLHGFHHPARALKNAEQEYELTDRQREIIIKHMWPLTIKPPMCREAWMVTAADKYCSFLETVHLQKGHRRKRKK